MTVIPEMTYKVGTVFVVLYDNYGDQGYDFCGVFETRQKALNFISAKESNPDRQHYYDIVEEEVQ